MFGWIKRKKKILLSILGVVVVLFGLLVAYSLIYYPGERGTRIKYGNDELYYTDAVTEEEALELGEYLVNTGFFNEENKGSAQLTKEDNVYQFRVVVNESAVDDIEYIKTAGMFAAHISNDVFGDKLLEIHLCNNGFETLQVVTYQIYPEMLEK